MGEGETIVVARAFSEHALMCLALPAQDEHACSGSGSLARTFRAREDQTGRLRVERPPGPGVELAAPVQTAGRVAVSWTSALPADSVRLVLTDDDMDSIVRCGATGERVIVCDRTSADAGSWEHATRWSELRWAGVVVERGVEVDATLTFDRWEFAS
ncbi:MAG TPA: hypothetical protein VM582_09150 [Candidatus Thermoplasmatota archaeon]|nr:hypothetical protein [Candidatus Thermoplasmatota archaeon]